MNKKRRGLNPAAAEAMIDANKHLNSPTWKQELLSTGIAAICAVCLVFLCLVPYMIIKCRG